jgi:hypothetical protein
VNYSTLSHESETCNRSPAISPTAFDTRPPDLPPASLMDTDFVVSCQLVRRRRPQIQFLSISLYLCSTLPSDPVSRRRPCALLPFTSIRLGRDLHPLAAEHARRTTEKPHASRFVYRCTSARPRTNCRSSTQVNCVSFEIGSNLELTSCLPPEKERTTCVLARPAPRHFEPGNCWRTNYALRSCGGHRAH